MKINISSLALMAATLGSTVNAWSFYVNGATIARDASNDVTCNSIVFGAIGQEIKFYEGFWEDCRLSLYLDSECEELFASFSDNEAYTLKDELLGYGVTCG